MKSFLYRIFCGFFLGISIFAPGVSGSVMAVMMGIYTRLIDIVSHPLKNIKRNIIFLFPMGIGAAISLVLFVLVFSYLFDTFPKATYLLFMGLMVGNIPVIFREANSDGFKTHYLIGILSAFGLALTVGLLRAALPEAQQLTESTVSLIYLGVCGAVAGVSSMVPGMSISMVLMVLGAYDHLLLAAKSVDIPVIAVVGLCFVLAMVAFSRLTRWVLKRYHNFAYFMVFGFMCGSLIGIYLGMPAEDPNFNWFIGALMLMLGLGISFLFVRLSKTFNAEIRPEETPV